MGLEASCTVRWNGRSSSGEARLEAEELYFRGDFRLKIPFREIGSASAEQGELRLRSADGTVVLELGPAAAKWLDKIRNPRGLLDKLGIKPGARVAVLGVEDPGFVAQVRSRATDVSEGRAKRDTHLIFYGVTRQAQLSRLEALRRAIRPDGAIWVVWPKGRSELKEDHVRAVGLAVGLTDVKVVAFSPTHSALKLMIPRASRPGR